MLVVSTIGITSHLDGSQRIINYGYHHWTAWIGMMDRKRFVGQERDHS